MSEGPIKPEYRDEVGEFRLQRGAPHHSLGFMTAPEMRETIALFQAALELTTGEKELCPNCKIDEAYRKRKEKRHDSHT